MDHRKTEFYRLKYYIEKGWTWNGEDPSKVIHAFCDLKAPEIYERTQDKLACLLDESLYEWYGCEEDTIYDELVIKIKKDLNIK